MKHDPEVRLGNANRARAGDTPSSTDRARFKTTLAELACGQRGLVTVEQLHAAGFDNAAIQRRRRAGRLHVMHRGVYLVGHSVAPEHAVELAAVLACGAGSVVSHVSALRLSQLDPPASVRPMGLKHAATRASVDITVAGRDPGRKRGIRIHRVDTLDARDVTCMAGIPVTAPARTLLDVANLLPFHDLEVVFADACARRLLRSQDLTELLQRNSGRRGAAVLRRLLALDQGKGLTRSEAERRLLALVRAAALPAPATNAPVGRLKVDFLWRAERVVVEVDGYAYHADKRSFERDRARDAGLVARGCAVFRVTWRQLTGRPESVAARIAAALAVRSAAT